MYTHAHLRCRPHIHTTFFFFFTTHTNTHTHLHICHTLLSPIFLHIFSSFHHSLSLSCPFYSLKTFWLSGLERLWCWFGVVDFTRSGIIRSGRGENLSSVHVRLTVSSAKPNLVLTLINNLPALGQPPSHPCPPSSAKPLQ